MTAYGSQTRSSEMRVRTPRPDGGCHQCWTSPSTNCRAAARSRCSRATSRLRDHQRHHVLELVAKPVGAAGLIERRARPDAAGQRLVEQPAVEHDVHGAVGRPHLDRAEHVVPVLATVRRVTSRSAPGSERSTLAPRPWSPPRRGRRRSRRGRPRAARSSSGGRRTDRGRRRPCPRGGPLVER